MTNNPAKNPERAQSLNMDSGNISVNAHNESSFIMNLKGGRNAALDQSNILDKSKNQLTSKI
jgi:hypothetical protein